MGNRVTTTGKLILGPEHEVTFEPDDAAEFAEVVAADEPEELPH